MQDFAATTQTHQHYEQSGLYIQLPNSDLAPSQGLTPQPLSMTSTSDHIQSVMPDQQSHLMVDPSLVTLDNLKVFLATAPTQWQPDQDVKRFTLPNGEHISCILWKNLFHVTGTDIVKSLVFRFSFEEGVFSDLRSLKPGVDATLEESRSEFLEYLFRANCIRLFWFSVPHDRLFMDALERDLKRESLGIEPTTMALTPMSLEATLELAKQHCMIPGFGLADPTSLSYPSSSPYIPPAHQATFKIPTHSQGYTPTSDRRLSFPGCPTVQEDQRLSVDSYDGTTGAMLPNNNNRFATDNSMVIRRRAHSHSFSSDSSVPYPISSPSLSDRSPGTYFCTFETCNRKFKRFEQLRRHMRCHVGDKPFVCPYDGCAKKYSRADSLNNHVKVHATGSLKQSRSPTPPSMSSIHQHSPSMSSIHHHSPSMSSIQVDTSLLRATPTLPTHVEDIHPTTIPMNIPQMVHPMFSNASATTIPTLNWKPIHGPYEPAYGTWNPEPSDQSFQLPPLSIPNNQNSGALPPLTPVINSFFSQIQTSHAA
ncbi:STE like transcription factor-domain-containing protein, partial [Chytridium lagenaria]